MAITAISRDWGSSPSIVRLTTTDDFATITAAGYLTTQIDIIEALNKGVFQWLDSDTISIVYADGQAFFTRDAQTNTFVAEVDIPAGSITTAMIANGAVTYPKIQNVTSTDRMLGRQSPGAGVVEEITVTAAGRAILDDADAAAQRATLGLGTIATQNANAVAITGGTIGAAVTGTTQAPATNNTTLATTAYADAAAGVVNTELNRRVNLTQTNVAANSNTTFTLVSNTSDYYKVTVSSNCTIAFTFPAGEVTSMCVQLINAGAFTVTFTGLLWAGGAAPTFTAAGTDVITIWQNGDNIKFAALTGLAFA